jgi:glycosidase
VFDGVFKNGGATRAIEEQLMRQRTKYAGRPNDDGVGVPARDLLVNFMDNHDVTRFLFDKPSLPALWNALAFLFTENGIPCIYYGTEQEFYGGNDPQNRERLWDTGFRTDGKTFQFMAKLIKIRKTYAALRRGDMTTKWSTTSTGTEEDAGMYAFERFDAESGKRVLVVLNTSDKKMSHTASMGTQMMTSYAAGTKLVDVLAMGGAGVVLTVGAGGALTVPVASREAKILVPEADVLP